MLCPKCGVEVIKANVGLGRHVLLEKRSDIYYVKEYLGVEPSAHLLDSHAIVHDCENTLLNPIVYSLNDLKKMSLLKLHEISTLLNISSRTIENWIHTKGIPYIKIGRLVRFDYEEVSKWIDSKRSDNLR